MDVLFWFKERTGFIRSFYEQASAPFEDRIAQIEAGEPPFEPMHDESDEPPYYVEWEEAKESLEVLGQTCVSMLSASLKLYFVTWEEELGVCITGQERKRAFKRGFLNGYKACLGTLAGVSWGECPADLELVEQVVLARNAIQHPVDITRLRPPVHPSRDLRKRRSPFFMDDFGRECTEGEFAEIGWLNPAVSVSGRQLLAAVDETEALADWLEPQLMCARWPDARDG